MMCASLNKPKFASLLISKEAGIKDLRGMTALMHAVIAEHEKMVELLIDCEACLTDNNGYGALQHC